MAGFQVIIIGRFWVIAEAHVGGVIIGAHQKDVVEGFIHDEICYDIPHSKKNSYIPATTSVTLKRGQEILAGDWYACYQGIKDGKPCE